MAKRLGEHSALGDILKDFIENNRLQKGLDKVAVKDIWHSMMGEAISRYTDDVKFDRDTLVVYLSSSVLREELSYGKEKIIAMLNEELGREMIKKLILK